MKEISCFTLECTNRKPLRLFWLKSNKLHRRNKPAYIFLHYNNKIYIEEYKIFGKFFRKNQEPTSVTYDLNGKNNSKIWKKSIIMDDGNFGDQRFREYGPAFINYIYDRNGNFYGINRYWTTPNSTNGYNQTDAVEQWISDNNIELSDQNYFEIPDEYKAEFKLIFG